MGKNIVVATRVAVGLVIASAFATLGASGCACSDAPRSEVEWEQGGTKAAARFAKAYPEVDAIRVVFSNAKLACPFEKRAPTRDAVAFEITIPRGDGSYFAQAPFGVPIHDTVATTGERSAELTPPHLVSVTLDPGEPRRGGRLRGEIHGEPYARIQGQAPGPRIAGRFDAEICDLDVAPGPGPANFSRTGPVTGTVEGHPFEARSAFIVLERGLDGSEYIEGVELSDDDSVCGNRQFVGGGRRVAVVGIGAPRGPDAMQPGKVQQRAGDVDHDVTNVERRGAVALDIAAGALPVPGERIRGRIVVDDPRANLSGTFEAKVCAPPRSASAPGPRDDKSDVVLTFDGERIPLPSASAMLGPVGLTLWFNDVGEIPCAPVAPGAHSLMLNVPAGPGGEFVTGAPLSMPGWFKSSKLAPGVPAAGSKTLHPATVSLVLERFVPDEYHRLRGALDVDSVAEAMYQAPGHRDTQRQRFHVEVRGRFDVQLCASREPFRTALDSPRTIDSPVDAKGALAFVDHDAIGGYDSITRLIFYDKPVGCDHDKYKDLVGFLEDLGGADSRHRAIGVPQPVGFHLDAHYGWIRYDALDLTPGGMIRGAFFTRDDPQRTTLEHIAQWGTGKSFGGTFEAKVCGAKTETRK